jgi:GAF domain-containing protein
MHPIRETREAIDELEPSPAHDDLLAQLMDLGRRTRELVPDCIGLSLANHHLGVTFTLVASDLDIAVLDAVQYIAGGPCVEAVEEDRVVSFCADPVDETSWQLFARAAASRGVASTLTLPIMVDATVTGSVNMYAASGRAFEGHHEQLAAILGAWAPGAVTNADLSFTTRQVAQRAPGLLRDKAKVETAVGLIAASQGIAIALARKLLGDAARQAGVAEVKLAEVILEVQRGKDSGGSD